MEIPERELWRKGIHFSGIILVPLLFWHRWIVVGLVSVFLVAYLFVEIRLKKDLQVPLLTKLATRSKRDSEQGKVSRGAVLLCVSCIALPYLVGVWPSAVALSQVFTADATATIAGMKWGNKKLPFSSKKTWVGTGVYFATAVLAALPFAPFWEIWVLALIGALVEALPLPEFDNLAIPVAVSLTALVLGYIHPV